MTILAIIIILITFYFVFSITQFINIVFRHNAPFILTDRETIRRILENISVVDNVVVYELGCGQAKFLRMIQSLSPRIRLIGYENLYLVYLWDKFLFFLLRAKIELWHVDFFKADLSKANIIYCYLNVTTMKLLGEKFQQECKKGTQIISRSFPIPQMMAEKIITVKNKKIFFYKI